MIRYTAVALTLVLGLLIAACGGDLSPASQISDLRVLAIRADPPEVRVPEDATLTTTAVDALVVGSEGAVSYQWTLCFIPGPITDGRLCLDPSAAIAVGEGPGVTLPIPSPELMLAQAPPEFAGFEVDLSDGLPIQIQLEVTDESGRSVTALKTITLSNRETTNTNPRLGGITLNGQTWLEGQVIDVDEGDTDIGLAPQWEEETREPYDDDSVPETESLLFSWFIDDEESGLAKERSTHTVPDNRFEAGVLDASAGETERNVTLWLVARDDRGGVVWLSRTIRIVRGN